MRTPSDTTFVSPGSRLHEVIARIQRRLEGEEGFTLVELTIVLLIMGILLSIAVPSYLTFKDNASKTSAKADVAQALRSVASYGADNYPSSPNDPDPGVSTSDSGYAGMQLQFLQAKYDAALSLTAGAPYVVNPGRLRGHHDRLLPHRNRRTMDRGAARHRQPRVRRHQLRRADVRRSLI